MKGKFAQTLGCCSVTHLHEFDEESVPNAKMQAQAALDLNAKSFNIAAQQLIRRCPALCIAGLL